MWMFVYALLLYRFFLVFGCGDVVRRVYGSDVDR